jgi:hypothetical protein
VDIVLDFTGACDQCRIRDGFVSEHMVCGSPLICLCFYSFQCPEAPCPAGKFTRSVVGNACGSGGIGRGGGSSCSCITCPAGEMIDKDVPFFFIHDLGLCLHKCDDQKYVVPSIDRICVCVRIHVGVAQASSTLQAYICISLLPVTPALLLLCI